MDRYSLQYGNRIPLAPSPRIILSINAVPKTVMITPNKAPAPMIRVKSCDALTVSPAPIFLATMALPPVASMVPSPTIRLITGHTILSADSALVPTNRATKIVSTIVYSPMSSIIIIVGSANFSNDFISKSCESGFPSSCTSFMPHSLRFFFP